MRKGRLFSVINFFFLLNEVFQIVTEFVTAPCYN